MHSMGTLMKGPSVSMALCISEEMIDPPTLPAAPLLHAACLCIAVYYCTAAVDKDYDSPLPPS